MLIKVDDGEFVEAQGIGSILIGDDDQVLIHYPLTDTTVEIVCTSYDNACDIANKLGEAVIAATGARFPNAVFYSGSTGVPHEPVVFNRVDPTTTEGESK